MEDVTMQFNSTLGAAFLGQFTAAVLYGITSLQAFFYYKQRPKDVPLLRWMIVVLWLLDSLHIALITHALYYYAVLHFMDPQAIEKPVWSIMTMIIVSNISNIIVRGIFSHRLWKLSGKGLILPLMIGILSLYIAGDAFYFATRGMQSSTYLQFHTFSWSLYVGFACEIVADGVITVSQCIFLSRYRTGIRSSDSVVSVLMMYSINTGLFTSICAILCLITFTVLPNMFVYFAFYFILSKLYVNSLLANLNARTTILENISAPAARPFGKFDVSSGSASGDSHLGPSGPQFSSVVDPLILTSAFPRDSVVTAEHAA